MAEHIFPTDSLIGLNDRELLMKQKSVVIWLTGLSGSGKSTLGRALEKKLLDEGYIAFLLDGEYHYISRVISTDGFTSINFRNPRDTDCIIYFSPEENFIEMILNNRIQMLNCTDRIIKINKMERREGEN